MYERSVVKDYYEKNGRFPTNDELVDLVNEYKDQKFFSETAERLDKEYPGKIRCAWMLGHIWDTENKPIVVYQSVISDFTEDFMVHGIFFDTAGHADLQCFSFLELFKYYKIILERTEIDPPVLFYKRDIPHRSSETENVQEKRSIDEDTELKELLRRIFPEHSRPSGRCISEVLDRIKNDFYKANGYIPAKEECMRMADEIKAQIRARHKFLKRGLNNEQ